MTGQESERYILGGISLEDIEEGERQAANGELVPLEQLREELYARIEVELDTATQRLEAALVKLKAIDDSWARYAQDIITKVKDYG
tara:strand:- start:30639 stop:30896 length:258 start_codon:yes stop_codon:yes gene_type:complete